MKCLFVKAPWAKWIVSARREHTYGVKQIEFRSKQTWIRGRIGIIESGTGTVIGDVMIVGCDYSAMHGCYYWDLAFPRRYLKPVKFKPKRGAVIWTNVEYDPEKKKIARKLTEVEFEKELSACLAATKKYLAELEGRRLDALGESIRRSQEGETR